MIRFLLIVLTIITLLSITFIGSKAGSAPNNNTGETQSDKEVYKLFFKSGDFTPAANLKDFITEEIDKEEIVAGKIYRIVQFYEIPSAHEKEELKKMGVNLLDYMPKRAYFASINAAMDRDLLHNRSIRSVVNPPLETKMQLILADRPLPAYAVNKPGTVDLIVSVYKDMELNKVVRLLGNSNLKILKTIPETGSFLVRVDDNEIEKVVRMSFVQYVEPVDPPGEPENKSARTLSRSNVLDSDNPLGRKYDGTGVSVMLQDDGVIGPHIDFQGRIKAQFTNDLTGNHGDHVAGTILGAGNLDPTTKGMAPGADIYVHKYDNGVDSIYSHYFKFDVTITSTSYSNGCNAGYTSYARRIDKQINDLPFLMHVFSAGNNGNSSCGYGAGSGWGNITGGHKVGKNCLTVGNVSEIDLLTNSSSRGPAHDGRIKPDICAKGTNVYSTGENYSYNTKTGTSMSCPGVSGSLAQLYQAYKELNGGENPPSALIKGTILNTADDLGNNGPDYKYGWGRINNLRAVRILENNTYLIDSISHNASKTHTINVPTDVAELRVMIYYHDVEATMNASVALINDLNMTVEDPSAGVHQPFVLDYTPNALNLTQPAVPGRDSINNMEQVVIQSPASGNYKINIDGYFIPDGPQQYFVIYEFVKDEIVLTYPIGGESLIPGEQELIRWDAYGNTGSFSVEFSSDSGQSWSILSNTVSGSQRFFPWTVPSLVSPNVFIKVSRNNQDDSSESVITIIEQPVIYGKEYCSMKPDLAWNSVAGASGYVVYMLGNKYMDSIAYLTDTFFYFPASIPDGNYWISVAAVDSNGGLGRRSNAQYHSIANLSSSLMQLPYMQDFETFNFCGPDMSCEKFICPLVDGWMNRTSGITDDIDWRVMNGTTPSGNTGPSTDYHPGTPSTNYLYLEGSGSPNACTFQTGEVMSPCIDLTSTSTPHLQFYYHMFGDAMGSLHVDVLDSSGWQIDVIPSISGNQGDEWKEAIVDLSAFNGQIVKIKFRGTTGSGFRSDIAIDDIRIADDIPAQLGFNISDTICAGQQIMVQNTTTGSDLIYHWDFGHLASPQTATTAGPHQVAYSDTGNQQIVLTVSNAFGQKELIKNFFVQEKPVANFITSINYDTVHFINQSTGATGNKWFFGNGDSTKNNLDTYSYNYGNTGTYDVILVINNKCGADTMTQQIEIVANGLKGNGVQTGFDIYPNPTLGPLNIELKQSISENLEVELMDVNGKVLLHDTYKRSGTGSLLELDLSHFPKGVYYIELKTAYFREVEKIILQ